MPDSPDIPGLVLRRTIAAAAVVGGRLSPRTASTLAVIGGRAEWALRPRKRQVLAQNLAHAFGREPGHPAVRAAVRDEIVNEARRSADFLWSVAHPDRMAAACRFDGFDHLEQALSAGNGAILAGLHLGGWEVVLPVARRLPVGVTVIVDDDCIAHGVEDVRRRAGVSVVSISTPPVRAMRALRDGGIVAVLPDIVKERVRTVEVAMLDGRIRLPTGPAAMARIAQAPIVPVSVLPIDVRAWRIALEPPLPPPPRSSGETGEQAVIQALAERWTAVLRRYPTHWAAVDPLPWVSACAPAAA